MPQLSDQPGASDRWALAALFAGAIGIGFGPVLVRLSDLGPTASAAWRTGLAAPVFFLLAAVLPRGEPDKAGRAGASGLAALLLAGALFAGDLGFWHASLFRTSVANATLFTNAAPILVTAGAWLLLGERITLRFLLGLVVAIAGAVLIVGDSLGRGGSYLAGDLLAMVSAGFYAAYLLSVSQLRRSSPAVVLMAWSSLGSALVLVAASLLQSEALLPASIHGWLVIIALAWVSQVAGQGLIAWALAHLPVSFSSVGLLLQPAAATLLALLILAEPLSPRQALGGLVILAGIYLARRSRSPG
jgi:drug/metabolite transporter (DMT)-like permease